MNRRAFLQGSACLSASFLVACAIPPIPDRPAVVMEDATGWIVHQDGRYRLLLPRAELGQGISTALKQIACDELGVAWDTVEVVLAPTSEVPVYRATVGSDSVRDYAVPLARACAALRMALARGEVSGTVDAAEIADTDLRFLKGGGYSGRRVRVEGHHEVVIGQPLFAGDVRRAGMAYGRVLRAPVSPEIDSAPEDWDEAAAKAVAGFIGVHADDMLRMNNSQGLGILAETPSALDRIEEALAVRWRTGSRASQPEIEAQLDIDARLADGDLSHTVVENGEVGDCPWDVDMRFDIPFGPHHAIEPRAAVAEIGTDSGEVWAGSQDPFYVRKAVASRLGLDQDRVVVQPMRVGGGFGGKTIVTVEIEAAVLSRLGGRPVKVQWTREQELRQGFHRPQSAHRVHVRLQEGRIAAWRHGFVSGHVIFTNAGLPAWMQTFTDFIGDDGVARGSAHDYGAPAIRVDYSLERLQVLTGPWRGLGAAPNAFAIESAMNACARQAGADPVVFRLDHIRDPRLAAVLRQAASLAGPAPELAGVARGVACGIYKGSSYAAVIAEVRWSPDGGARLTGLWCAHDCGFVVNPDIVKAQCEGNLVWGVSMTLFDRLEFADGRIAADDFVSAPVPSIGDVPPMSISLMRTDHPPSGAGETAMVAGAGAIANAVANLTGVQPTRLPIDLAALERERG